jgi:hypothetical protein
VQDTLKGQVFTLPILYPTTWGGIRYPPNHQRRYHFCSQSLPNTLHRPSKHLQKSLIIRSDADEDSSTARLLPFKIGSSLVTTARDERRGSSSRRSSPGESVRDIRYPYSRTSPMRLFCVHTAFPTCHRPPLTALLQLPRPNSSQTTILLPPRTTTPRSL